jgi:hypothetical protein
MFQRWMDQMIDRQVQKFERERRRICGRPGGPARLDPVTTEPVVSTDRGAPS